MLELYKTPLEAIPLPQLNFYEHLVFDRLSKSIILLEGERYDTTILQKVGDFLIVEHYFSKNKGNESSILNVVSQDLESIFEKGDDQKRIEKLQKMSVRWKKEKNTVMESMKDFESKYPQICASILSSEDV